MSDVRLGGGDRLSIISYSSSSLPINGFRSASDVATRGGAGEGEGVLAGTEPRLISAGNLGSSLIGLVVNRGDGDGDNDDDDDEVRDSDKEGR